jgi:aspartyl/asparaginyl beta-hydroxylase (cupin superfamily)
MLNEEFNDKCFHSLETFPQFKILEENYEGILKELKAVMTNEKTGIFEPWIERNLYEESNEEGWNVAPLMIGGVVIQERSSLFPLLMKLINNIQGIMSVSFSLLKPDTHIVPHKGYDDYSEKVLRYHMGLIIPDGDVGIRVENELRTWQEGKSFVFDDYMVHEAWNYTEEDRIVLIIDFLREKYINNKEFLDENFHKSSTSYFK